MKSFQPPNLIQKTAFPATKVEVNKLDVGRHRCSPLFKRLKNGVYLDPGLLENNILKCLPGPIFVM